MKRGSMAVRIGKLRHRVTVQAPSVVKDTLAQDVKSWATVGTFWAEVVPKGGREAVNAQQVRADSNFVVRMRYQGSTAITPQCQLIHRGRTLKITSVNDVDERRRELEIACQEVVSS
jgi:SPP1 family predicted phage head-tail adaptor